MTLSILRLTPITPVEATRTWRSLQPSEKRVRAGHRFGVAMPCGPVQALAQPLFTTIARAGRRTLPRCPAQTMTGAACARLIVNTPAAVAGLSDDDQCEVGLADRLDPACDAGGAEALRGRDAAIDRPSREVVQQAPRVRRDWRRPAGSSWSRSILGRRAATDRPP